jgi:hypothetical protein
MGQFTDLALAFSVGGLLMYAVCWRASRDERCEASSYAAHLETEIAELRQRLDMAIAAFNEQEALANFDCAECGQPTPWRTLRPNFGAVCEDCVDATRCFDCGAFGDDHVCHRSQDPWKHDETGYHQMCHDDYMADLVHDWRAKYCEQGLAEA